MAVENLPAGFRFHPTDEELISYYLMRKVSDTNFSCKAVAVVDLNKSEPWDLPGKATMGEKEWYFFSMKDRKYPTGLRTNRATESGYWKTTGKDKEIYAAGGGGVLIGMKKTLVFYKGRAPRGNKTNWVIHEYRLHNNNNHHHPFKSSKEEWVVCRVFQKSTAPKRSSPQASQEYQEYSPPCNNETSVFNEEYGADADDEFPNIANSSTTAAAFNTMMMNHSPSLFPPWPSGILNNNLSMNSLLLKALQLRTYQQQAAAAANNINHFAAYNNNNNDNDIDCIPQGFSSSHQPLGTTTDFISSNLNNNNNVVSGSRVLECMSQQQEQPPMW